MFLSKREVNTVTLVRTDLSVCEAFLYKSRFVMVIVTVSHTWQKSVLFWLVVFLNMYAVYINYH